MAEMNGNVEILEEEGKCRELLLKASLYASDCVFVSDVTGRCDLSCTHIEGGYKITIDVESLELSDV